MALILRDAGLSALVEGGVETLATGFQFTEGPLWLPGGDLLFQDIKAERTYRLGPEDSVAVLRERTGAANGQTFAADGRIAFCEQNGRRVSHMDRDGGRVEPIVETYAGKRLNSPNDIVARPDGRLYFTDPPYGVPSPEQKELPFQGVFTIDPDDTPRPLVTDFEKPNGLAFAPDGRTLYVCDTARYHVRAFAVTDAGDLQPDSGRILATMDPEMPGGPDGMKVDRAGRLWVAVAQGLWVFEPDGRLLGILALPKRPSNLAWCGPDARTLAITAVDAVHRVRLTVEGVLPPFTPAA